MNSLEKNTNIGALSRDPSSAAGKGPQGAAPKQEAAPASTTSTSSSKKTLPPSAFALSAKSLGDMIEFSLEAMKYKRKQAIDMVKAGLAATDATAQAIKKAGKMEAWKQGISAVASFGIAGVSGGLSYKAWSDTASFSVERGQVNDRMDNLKGWREQLNNPGQVQRQAVIGNQRDIELSATRDHITLDEMNRELGIDGNMLQNPINDSQMGVINRANISQQGGVGSALQSRREFADKEFAGLQQRQEHFARVEQQAWSKAQILGQVAQSFGNGLTSGASMFIEPKKAEAEAARAYAQQAQESANRANSSQASDAQQHGRSAKEFLDLMSQIARNDQYRG